MIDNKINKLICYGAGEMAEVYADFLSFLEVDILFWVDSNKQRTGETYLGYEVKDVEALFYHQGRILITSMYQDEIKMQLFKMGMQDRIVSLEELMKACASRVNVKNNRLNNSVTVVMDAYDGSGDWAGTELWALRLSKFIINENCLFVTKGMDNNLLSEKTTMIGFSPKDVCKGMIEYMEKSLPIVLIQGFGKHAMFSASYLKLLYPDKIKIVSVLHNDTDACVRRQLVFASSIDRVFAVSSMVRERASKWFKGKEIATRTQAISIPVKFEREYMKNGIIRIGYGARLTKLQKRADLLIDVIQKLEQTGIPYILNIAGDGECAKEIKSYIEKEKLAGKVNLYGKITADEMKDFWIEQDIFLSMSEYEGCSLSMLEAMSFMCVPVVTNVSGVNEVVIHEMNGYIYDAGKTDDAIAYIVNACDKEKLYRMGANAYDSVSDKCNYEDYANWWNSYINELAGGLNAEVAN